MVAMRVVASYTVDGTRSTLECYTYAVEPMQGLSSHRSTSTVRSLLVFIGREDPQGVTQCPAVPGSVISFDCAMKRRMLSADSWTHPSKSITDTLLIVCIHAEMGEPPQPSQRSTVEGRCNCGQIVLNVPYPMDPSYANLCRESRPMALNQARLIIIVSDI